MKTRLLFLLVALSIIFNPKLKAGIEDACGTTSGSSAPYLPTSGNIKVFVIFAQFRDDPNTNNNGWAKNSYPDWANTFVNSSSGGTYPWNNLSHYFNEMSNGTYQVIGDVYDALVTTDYDESYYSSIGQVNREIIMEVDPYVNFAEYDNLNGSSSGSDGKVDFIYIIYRNATSSDWYYSGIALLETSQTITVDGKQIVNNSYIGGGVQQRGGYNGRDYTLYISAHEMGHYLFGGGHVDGVSNLALMTGGPAWNAGRGMCSWERQKLGWISYADKSTDGSITMSDYMTQDQVYRVPISSSEYFLIENRKKLSPHDMAGDNGFYFYRVTGASYFPPTIDVLCADGNWDFTRNTTAHTLTRTTPNPNGYDEISYVSYYDNFKYACYTPVYFENSAWGDNEDAFDQTFNNVFSPVSNPRNTSSLQFSIEVTGTDQITFYFDGDGSGDEFAGKPSKPQNLIVSAYYEEAVLNWQANTEPDMQNGGKYKIYRSEVYGTGDPVYWDLVANIDAYSGSTPITTWTDPDASIKINPRWLHYKIVAVDNTNLESVASNITSINGKIPKRAIEQENQEINISFNLVQNYPNPFNPSSTIAYSIAEKGFVSLKVYDILGNEIAELVNNYMEKGNYQVKFDGSKLSSGIYFCKLTAGYNNSIKKMLLIK